MVDTMGSLGLTDEEDLKNVLVLRDESVTECPICRTKLKITANDGYLVEVEGKKEVAIADCEEEIIFLPCCDAEAMFDATALSGKSKSDGDWTKTDENGRYMTELIVGDRTKGIPDRRRKIYLERSSDAFNR